jgi:hypothetical protein
MANGELSAALHNNSFRKTTGRLANEGGVATESGNDWERVLSYKQGFSYLRFKSHSPILN